MEDHLARLCELKARGLKSIAMTSNGIALYRKLPELVKNGLTHLNLRSVLERYLLYLILKSGQFGHPGSLQIRTYDAQTRTRDCHADSGSRYSAARNTIRETERCYHEERQRQGDIGLCGTHQKQTYLSSLYRVYAVLG